MKYGAASLQLDQLQDRAQQLVKHQMLIVAREWQRSYPKRSIEFVDTMGYADFSIDDGKWYAESCDLLYPKDNEEMYGWGARKLVHIFQPLYEALGWYSKWSDTFGINVGFKLEPISQKETR